MPAYDALMALVDRAVQSHLGGEPVIYQSAVGNPVPVTGIFDAAFVLDEGDAHAGVEAVGPAVFLQVADLPVDPEDDDPTLTIRGLDYRVIERRTADFGSIVLALRRVVNTPNPMVFDSMGWFDADVPQVAWFDLM